MGITVLLIFAQRRDSLNLKERKTLQRDKALPHFRDSAGLISTIRDKDDDFCSPVHLYPGMHCHPDFIRSITLTNGREMCLDPESKHTRAVLRGLKLREAAKNSTTSKPTTAPKTATTTVSASATTSPTSS
ncbi:hypothetical protein GBF38_005214 [Nibea albiflora]|uniref:Uncharacterized protein n=1 Tax=Nibea albiflora TaxID=240163 RepID=A0ACB7EVJ9_NIBAL|nr:hypothetical protein GBF38_005214 [Nibea albiflora]